MASSFDSEKRQVFVAPQIYNAAGDDVDLRGLVMMLWRQKFVVIAAMVVGIILAGLAVALIKPLYTGRTLLLIEANAGSGYSKEIEALAASLKRNNSVALSEIEVIRSRNLARKIVMKYELMNDPAFNPQTHGVAPLNSGRPGGDFKALSVYTTEMPDLPDDVMDKNVANVVSRFLSRLSVRSVPGSNAVQIEYLANTPQQAAMIANAVADSYIEQRLDNKFESAKKVRGWLDKRLVQLREQVRMAEAQVIDYKARYNIMEGTRSGVSQEELSQLNQQLVEARVRRADAEAKYEQISGFAKNTEKIENAPDVFRSDLVQKLKLDAAIQQSKLEELKARYGPKHPQIIEARSELEAVRSILKAEVMRTVESIKNELSLAQIQVETLERNMRERSGTQLDEGAAMIRLRELEREAEASRMIYDSFLETYKKGDEQEELQDPDARILSYASPPTSSSYPNKRLIMSLGAVASLFAGLALAIILEKLDNTFRSAAQLEQATGVSCYGMIPALKEADPKEMARYVMTKPSSTLAESVRSLRTTLGLRNLNLNGKTQIITMTSSFPGEGKTTLSVWLARLAAKSGEKVLLIDADLRRPNVHRLVNLKNDATLVDYLTGLKELDEVIQKDDASGMHVIRAASVPNSALDLINSEKMRKFLTSLRQVYGLIIIDSPACLAVSDSVILATLSDATLYTVSWDETPREVVLSGVKQFVDAGYDRMALVLTNVDIKRHAQYGYGDSIYYYGRYKEYYAA